MSDRLIMENYLLNLKSTVEVFVHGTLESSNDDVRCDLKKGLDEIMNNQKETYSLMTKCGFYDVSNVSNKEVEKVLNNVTKKE
ncbi:MAG: spore coat protein [Bacilli bacterium]|nr:spore coat protein [Bacilli bacterium]